MSPLVSHLGRSADDSVDDLVKSYADADRSDTFVSYNDAIVLAREVRRLRKHISRMNRLRIDDNDIAAVIAADRAEHG